jgi:hypothetical protein
MVYDIASVPFVQVFSNTTGLEAAAEAYCKQLLAEAQGAFTSSLRADCGLDCRWEYGTIGPSVANPLLPRTC